MTIGTAEMLAGCTPVDYLAVGNPTLDVLPDSSFAIGGSMVYAVVQAARLGLSAAGVGRGCGVELAPLWTPFETEAFLHIQPSPDTTRFRNENTDSLRTQWLEKSAGAVSGLDRLPESRVLHLAPVAREIVLDDIVRGSVRGLVGLTPQGLIRSWDDSRLVRHHALRIGSSTARNIDAVVFADYEAAYLTGVAEAVRRAGGIVVVTKGPRGAEVLLANGKQEFSAIATDHLVDDTGAGDVFAASLFIALDGGFTVSDAVRFAAAAAALSIGGIGPRAIATRNAVVKLAGRDTVIKDSAVEDSAVGVF
ncbi:PfkB family carbohydrate kinase [Protofrankia symbiont of Coriaria ruscifolia]|uniref:PfkB family carbohydrate kinase n=1 Tax=Protofrankia symbiont of Coriaria ruscifolia TaxID=1306542 RepID=UPI001A949DFA|nr:PfkB family carbohydrate kinase [Protofrankia symbiont of Coriaria ruscifolia]